MDRATESNILGSDRDWISLDEEIPEIGQLVVIRMTHPTAVYEGTNIPVEDIKIAKFLRKIGTSEGRFVIEPPYPKYDYSPLSCKERLYDETIVTHWSIASDEDIESWRNRYHPFNTYSHLSLEVDDSMEQDVYNALLYASSYYNNSVAILESENKKEKNEKIKEKNNMAMERLRYMATILYDLQFCIDSQKPVINGDIANHFVHEMNTMRGIVESKDIRQNEDMNNELIAFIVEMLMSYDSESELESLDGDIISAIFSVAVSIMMKIMKSLPSHIYDDMDDNRRLSMSTVQEIIKLASDFSKVSSEVTQNILSRKSEVQNAVENGKQ